ncbi:MAG: YqhA family protein [Hydrogenothermaceae bacterium]
MNKLEQIFERLIWESRLMVILAVLASIFAALVLTIMGSYDILMVFLELFHAFSDKEIYEQFHKDAVIHIISAIDSYLIATVLLIFGIGLYELFVSKIDYAEKDTKSSRVLIIHSLDQLKDKLAKVIVMVLIVTFFKYAVSFKYEDILSLFYLSVGIILIALAIFFLAKSHEKHKVEANHEEH